MGLIYFLYSSLFFEFSCMCVNVFKEQVTVKTFTYKTPDRPSSLRVREDVISDPHPGPLLQDQPFALETPFLKDLAGLYGQILPLKIAKNAVCNTKTDFLKATRS